MTDFPSGPFTIVNQETGRAVRVRLGRTVDHSYHQLGTKYLLGRTDPPGVELGPADGSPATRWYYRPHEDALERQPYFQLASSAVRDLQNIGEYCVWMHGNPSAEAEERHWRRKQFANLLGDVPDDLARTLVALIPEKWTAVAEKEYTAELAAWEKEGEPLLKGLKSLNARQATALEKLRTQQAAMLGKLRANHDMLWKAYEAHPRAIGTTIVGNEPQRPRTREEVLDALEQPLLWGTQRVERIERQMEQAPPEKQAALLERQVAALEMWSVTEVRDNLKNIGVDAQFLGDFERVYQSERELVLALKAESPTRAWQLRAPLRGVARWNAGCAWLALYDADGLRASDREHVEAMRTYVAAAEKGGVTVPPGRVSAGTTMYGCGAKRYKGSTYRWVFDGTHIYAADSTTLPSQATYWTDEEGALVGKAKGGPGQKWTLAKVEEAPTRPSGQTAAEAVFFTGLFGPITAASRVLPLGLV
ncbi:hypothetical protein ACGF1Z_35100 [Streptomyces sp. NPDC048018]|uniref:hypothetical protein n=1 Tax=Streptomyces sp. NPDC048018 TaxID=3365499 RepID=UPI00371BF838